MNHLIYCALMFSLLIGCTAHTESKETLKLGLPIITYQEEIEFIGGFKPSPSQEKDEQLEKVSLRIKELAPDTLDEKARQYAALFLKYSREYGLDVNMVVHISFIESRFRQNVISRTGDYGLMQINWKAHGATLKKLGIDKQSILDPEINVEYGCRLLSEFSRKSRSLYGIIKRYSPARPRYYANKLNRLMNQSNI